MSRQSFIRIDMATSISYIFKSQKWFKKHFNCFMNLFNSILCHGFFLTEKPKPILENIAKYCKIQHIVRIQFSSILFDWFLIHNASSQIKNTLYNIIYYYLISKLNCNFKYSTSVTDLAAIIEEFLQTLFSNGDINYHCSFFIKSACIYLV